MPDLDVYAAMSTLRAVRRLRPDPIPDAVLRRVLTAATWAPTGGNQQPLHMIVVDEPELKRELGRLYLARWSVFSGYYRKRLKGLAATEFAAQERTLAAGDYLANTFGEVPCIVVFCFNPAAMAITDSKLDRVSVVGGGSVYTAVQNLLLACRKEGLGCVLTTLLCECEPEIKSLLAIPEGWGTAATVPIGYPVGRGHGPISRRGIGELTSRNQFGVFYV